MFNCTIHPRVTAGLNPGTVYSFGIFYFGKRYILSKFSIIVFHAFPSIICLKLDPSKLKFYDRIPCSERRKWHFRGSNFKNFPGEHAPGPPLLVKTCEHATVRFSARSAPAVYMRFRVGSLYSLLLQRENPSVS